MQTVQPIKPELDASNKVTCSHTRCRHRKYSVRNLIIRDISAQGTPVPTVGTLYPFAKWSVNPRCCACCVGPCQVVVSPLLVLLLLLLLLF